MKLLSLQPSSLYENGGCGRLLRRLYANYENNVTSLYISVTGRKHTGPIHEIKVDALPLHKPWMRWKLRTFFNNLRYNIFSGYTSKQLKKQANKINFDILHIINQGADSCTLLDQQILQNKKLWVSFHDHFVLCSSREDCNNIWNKAERRFVISDELGKEYQRIFGTKEFEVITDGVYENEISAPISINKNKVIQIYFGGLLHVSYLPLFETLADALDRLSNTGLNFKVLIRGTQNVKFLDNRLFEVEYRNDFVNDKEIKAEHDQSDILYLPIKFNDPEFYLYSLSTKMVGYLGASGAILYHGPKNSAALNLLAKNNCAASCISLDIDDMISAIQNVIERSSYYSSNAKELASKKFSIKKIQNKFWQQ